MAVAALMFVSNRLQPAALALLCLVAAQLIGAVISAAPAVGQAIGAVRVALRH